jgi:UDPglucose 6-dehydrogenase
MADRAFPATIWRWRRLREASARPRISPKLRTDSTCLQIDLLAGLVKKHLISGGRAGILGLTYKPNTDVVEQAAGYLLAQQLAADGVSVVASDPEGNVTPRRDWTARVVLIDSAEECIRAVRRGCSGHGVAAVQARFPPKRGRAPPKRRAW